MKTYDFRITNSSIHHNITERDLSFSAAIEAYGRLFLTNSTMADNNGPTPNNGMNISSWEEAWIQNSTLISHGILMNVETENTLYLRNSILLSTASNPLLGQCETYFDGKIVSKGGNLVQDSSCVPIPVAGDRVISYSQARLGTLGDYGGPTPTIPPLMGSPARNRVPTQCIYEVYEPIGLRGYRLLDDQRRIPRIDGQCDAGAFEDPLFLQNLPIIRK